MGEEIAYNSFYRPTRTVTVNVMEIPFLSVMAESQEGVDDGILRDKFDFRHLRLSSFVTKIKIYQHGRFFTDS